MVRTSSLSILAILAFGSLAAEGCYDHSYTQAIKAKRKAAEAAKGAEVTAGGFDRAIRHEGRVRVYASPEYRARNSGWARRVIDLVDSTGRILGPAFAVRLEVVDTFEWSPSCDPADLEACLNELAAHDPGNDVDWVVGLLGAQPRFTTTFDDLGMATVPGRHLLLRDLYDAGEHAAIDQAFSSMSQAKRAEIYRARQEHKRLVVFLHEWGHTLGALHTRDDATILHPSYDDEMEGFSEENMALIDASLRDRFPFEGDYPHLREYIETSESEGWLPGEREVLLAALQGGPSSAPTGNVQHGLMVPGDTKQLLKGVKPEDQARYDRAAAQLNAGETEAAWDSLAPLLPAYPNCYAIQHFGCGLAMHVGAREEAGRACRRSIEFTEQ